jgi:hypothetical protein
MIYIHLRNYSFKLYLFYILSIEYQFIIVVFKITYLLCPLNLLILYLL